MDDCILHLLLFYTNWQKLNIPKPYIYSILLVYPKHAWNSIMWNWCNNWTSFLPKATVQISYIRPTIYFSHTHFHMCSLLLWNTQTKNTRQPATIWFPGPYSSALWDLTPTKCWMLQHQYIHWLHHPSTFSVLGNWESTAVWSPVMSRATDLIHVDFQQPESTNVFCHLVTVGFMSWT